MCDGFIVRIRCNNIIQTAAICIHHKYFFRFNIRRNTESIIQVSITTIKIEYRARVTAIISTDHIVVAVMAPLAC